MYGKTFDWRTLNIKLFHEINILYFLETNPSLNIGKTELINETDNYMEYKIYIEAFYKIWLKLILIQLKNK